MKIYQMRNFYLYTFYIKSKTPLLFDDLSLPLPVIIFVHDVYNLTYLIHLKED